MRHVGLDRFLLPSNRIHLVPTFITKEKLAVLFVRVLLCISCGHFGYFVGTLLVLLFWYIWGTLRVLYFLEKPFGYTFLCVFGYFWGILVHCEHFGYF